MNGKPNQPEKDLKPLLHRSFLLRMWRTPEPGPSDWRASLETLDTGKHIGFATLEQLFVFLMDLSESNGDLQSPED